MISTLIHALASRARALRLRIRGTQITGRVWLRSIRVPRQAHRITLDDGAALDDGVVLLVSGSTQAAPAISIGPRVYINRHTLIDASGSVHIGADCMIGPFCYITDHDHSFGADSTPASGALITRPVVIESRCWIGAHVSILKGITIGQGAVVGAGSVVTKDVPAGAVVAGNPARPLRSSPQP